MNAVKIHQPLPWAITAAIAAASRRGGEEPVGGSASGLGEGDVHGGLLDPRVG